MKYKYKVSDVVWVYRRDSLSEFLGIIKDRDAHEKSYLVCDVYNPDIDSWVMENQLLKLERLAPSFWTKLKMFFTH